MLGLPNIGDINEQDGKQNNMAPILDAAKCGNSGVVKLLLSQKGINPDVKTADGLTVLDLAKQSGTDAVFQKELNQLLQERKQKMKSTK